MSADELHSRGAAAQGRGEWQVARESYEAALALDPAHLPSLVDLGVVRYWLRDYDGAAELFVAALRQRPTDRGIATNLARAYEDGMRPASAERLWRALIAADPDDAGAHYHLGSALMWRARHREAIASYAEALARAKGPARAQAWKTLVNAHLYAADVAPETVRDLGAAAAAEFAPAEKPPPFANDPDPERRLRVGYVTSDLRAHSAARSFDALFEHADRSRFAIHVYHDTDVVDPTTERFRARSDGWRTSYDLDPPALARAIRADGIDVLVTMAQHFDRNRIDPAIHRAAPVRINAFDVATSGTDAYDAFFADPTMAAARGDGFTERVVRLRAVYVHPPLDWAPPTASAPSAAGAPVAFGSANNPAKISSATIALWAAVLRTVDGSTLRLKFHTAYREKEVRDDLAARFAAHGVAPDRLVFELGAIGNEDHLRFYERVDVALDTFPFTGSTTTFEALWMGVPVVTRAGATVVSRWSTGMLARIGRRDLAAGDDASFVTLAAREAANAKHQDREGLRRAVRNSVLCDGPRQARDFERAYRALWRRWCARART
ncbi:MAG: tetratricopeptide repeat protein [Tagaea sp.]|nr:tetratricopeptide repeat protein [Tagaea sp.]